MIEIITMPKELNSLRNCVEKHILRLSCNSNGTHIIQKIIGCFEEEKREFVNDFIINNLAKMSTNANGICVVRKIDFLF